MDCVWAKRDDGKLQCSACGWVYPREPNADPAKWPHRNCGTAKASGVPATPRPPVEMTDTQRAEVIDKMRESIVVMIGVDVATVEPRLAKCQACETLCPEGCGLPCNCSERWPKWRDRITSGDCKEFKVNDGEATRQLQTA